MTEKKQYHSRPLLEIKNFSLSFNADKNDAVVNDVSFSLYPNEFIGIIGESGSGKSITAKAILQLNARGSLALPNSKILYGGDNLLKLKEDQIRKIRGREIAIVFQDPMTYLNPTATIGSQIKESLTHHFPHYTSDESYAKTIELLKVVELPNQKDLYKRYPHELSGGMRQRVMIAIALAPNPRIFIADEITTALDVTVQHEILTLLKKLQRTLAMSIIFITHDLSIVAKFASRVIVMYKGHVVEEGLSNTICFSPSHPYTKALVDSIPKMEMTKKTRLETMDVLRESSPSGCIFYGKCKVAKEKCKRIKPTKQKTNDGCIGCHYPLNTKKEESALCTNTLS